MIITSVQLNQETWYRKVNAIEMSREGGGGGGGRWLVVLFCPTYRPPLCILIVKKAQDR